MKNVEIRLGDRTVVTNIDGERVYIENTSFSVQPVGRGLYRVSDGTGQWVVAVAGPAANRWVWIDGRVAEIEIQDEGRARPGIRTSRDELSSPMPATVIRVLVQPGARVSRRDTLVVLEAMKMEWPVRAPRDGVVTAVHCQNGELVQPGVNLLDLE